MDLLKQNNGCKLNEFLVLNGQLDALFHVSILDCPFLYVESSEKRFNYTMPDLSWIGDSFSFSLDPVTSSSFSF